MLVLRLNYPQWTDSVVRGEKGVEIAFAHGRVYLSYINVVLKICFPQMVV
jgi:hypothetical protein